LWVGGVGTAVDIIALALAGIGASTFVWLLLLAFGVALLLYAFFMGEDESPSAAAQAQSGDGGISVAAGRDAIGVAEAGSGDGDLRGNVIGPNATISIDRSVRTEGHVDPLAGKRRLRKTLGELRAECSGKTKIRQDQIIKPHLGAWIRLSGVVEDVNLRSDGKTHRVTFTDRGGPGEFIFLEFTEDHQEALPTLDKGDEIEIIGELQEFSRLWVELGNCELLE
jgi:hypothetical protein